MTRVYATFAAILLLLVFGSGLWLGYKWGASVRANEVDGLTKANATLAGERDAARQAANGNAGNLVALRNELERSKRELLLQQQLAEKELGTRADRIAALERDAEKRKNILHKEAAANEDCAALRDLPVCAAVADRLWGGTTATRPH